MRLFISTLVFLSSFGGWGCSSVKINVQVDSLSEGKSFGKRYLLQSPTPSVSIRSLQFKEFAKYVNRTMMLKDYIPVDDLKNADFVMYLDYDIGGPQTSVVTDFVPISTSIEGRSYSIKSAQGSPLGNIKESNSNQTSLTPVTHSVVEYMRVIHLRAYKVSEMQNVLDERAAIWETTIKSLGYSSSLRELVPAMLAAALNFIGKDSQGEVKLSIDADDARIEILRAGRMPSSD